MTATARTFAHRPRHGHAPIVRWSSLDRDLRPGLADDETHRFGPSASPWRAPLFYLSFIAAALLLAAVGVILVWRILSRG